MKVNEFRLSRVWVEGVTEQMTVDSGPLGGLVRRDFYAPLFTRLLDVDDDQLLTLPWPRGVDEKLPGHNRYWNGYVVKELRDHPKGDRGALAWNAVVPLARKTALVRIGHAPRSFVNGWYHPHGVATAVTASFQGSFDPAEMEAAANAFLTEPLDTRWENGSTGSMALNVLVSRVLDGLRTEAFGDAARGFQPDPHTVLTMVRASADPGDDEKAAEPFVRSALAIAGAQPPAALEPNQAIYAISRARVVWRHDRAVSSVKNVHTLGCLHRNVTVATMQVESLLRAAEMLGALCQASGNSLPARIEPFARRVAGLIGRILGGKKTYAPPFVRDHVARANAQGALDALRMCVDLTALA